MAVAPPTRRGRGTARALLLVALVVLAGCNGSPTADERSPAATPTVTPAPVPTATPTPTPVPTVEPGIAVDGTVRPAVVLARHRRALGNHSYTFTFRRTVRNDTGVRSETYVRAWVAHNASSYRMIQYVNVSRPPRIATTNQPAVDVWRDGPTAYFRVTDSTGTPYLRAEDVDRGTIVDPTFPELLRGPLSAVRLRPVDRPGADGTTRFAATAVVNRSAIESPPGGGRVTNVSLVVVLSEEGIVRETRLTFETTLDGERVRVVRTTRVSGLDGTTVPVPAWVPDSARSADGRTAGTPASP